MLKLTQALALAAVLALGVAAAEPAAAKPGATLQASIKLARAQKSDLMGVTYYVSAGKVVGESWSSELSGWSEKTADKYRVLLVGKKKLKSRQAKGQSIVFTYADGTLVQYNMSRGKVVTLDATAPSFSQTALAAKKYQRVLDWKQEPHLKKAW
jgi:hypothetical protein